MKNLETESGIDGADAGEARETPSKAANEGSPARRNPREKAWLAGDETYRNLVEFSLDGICLLEDQKLCFVNPRLCEMLECETGDLLGTSFTDHLAPEELARTVGLYRRMTRHDAFPQRYETVLMSRKGNRLDVGISADMIEADGHPVVMILVHDISEQKRSRRMAIENERLAAVRAVARSVGSSFAGILSVISSYAASISDSFLPNTRPHESSRKILEAAQNASELTKRLLGVVRVSGPEAHVQLEPVSVVASIRKACELVQPTLKDRGIQISFEPGPASEYVLADAGQFLDVLMNILLNGADAMPQGGDLRVAITRCKSKDDADVKGGHADFLEVSIMDNGIGMSARQVSKVFEPFYTTKQGNRAFGLGLPVAQNMVKDWGGRIEISSQPKEGTCVRVFMLRTDPPEHAEAPQGNTVRTVLVVDDHPERREMMVRTLHEDGFSVLEADCGEQAIALFKSRTSDIDLTVLDWIMPGLDGREVYKIIHKLEPRSRVLMISGFSKDYVRSQIRMGAWAFLQQPFSENQFREAVQRALR